MQVYALHLRYVYVREFMILIINIQIIDQAFLVGAQDIPLCTIRVEPQIIIYLEIIKEMWLNENSK